MLHGRAPSPMTNGPVLTWIGQASNSNSATTHDFGNFVIPNDALVIVGYVGLSANAVTVSSVSIGGVNGEIEETFGSASQFKRAIAARRVSAGTHNVTVTLSSGGGATASHFVGVWMLTNNASDDAYSSTDTGAGASSTSEVATMDLPFGVAVYIGFTDQGSSHSWSSATQVAAVNTNVRWALFAQRNTAEATAYAETLSWSGSVPAFVIAASWR